MFGEILHLLNAAKTTLVNIQEKYNKILLKGNLFKETRGIVIQMMQTSAKSHAMEAVISRKPPCPYSL